MVATWIGHNHRCYSILSRIGRHRGILVAVASTPEVVPNKTASGRRTFSFSLSSCRYWYPYPYPYRYPHRNKGMRMSSSSAATKHHYYDSHGDYQADDESGYFLPYSSKNKNKKNNNNNNNTPLPLFQHQESLPRFPVPTVADTIERLKPSCLPLATDDGEKQRFLRACDRFPEQVRELQRGLEDRALTQENWLQVWWNQHGYLGFREPSPINVNYFFQLPKSKSKNTSTNTSKAAGRTLGQLERGARVLHSARAYSELVGDGSLPQEAIGKQGATPLCSSMYKYLFHSCRIPKPNRDVYRIYHSRRSANPCEKPNSSFPNHAVVSVRGHYFSVDLTDSSTGRPHSVAELELALEECVERASSLFGDDDTNASAVRNLGILTAAHRDEWATNRAKLLDVVPGMDTALETLESGLLLLVLDGHENENNNNNDKDDKTKQIAHVDSLSQNARSYLMGTEGRWYDKSLQFIVTPSGDLGLNGEHSMMDGMPVVGLCQYILRRETETETASSARSPPRVKPVFANDTILTASSANHGLAATRAMVDRATADFNELRESLDLEVQSFRGYGASWIKSRAGCSPDAFVQMAIQLAVGKLAMHPGDHHGPNREQERASASADRRYLPWATYESTQVRPYRYGRTETTRSVSPQSAEWVESMLYGDISSNPNSVHRSRSHNNNKNNDDDDDDDDNHQSKRRNLFRKATDAHVDYIRKASRGGGVDRHLFGLQMIRAEREQRSQSRPEVDLFGDPLFVRSKAWRVSTSTLPVNPGFGPVVVPEGVGIAYDVRDDHIYFTCTSYRGLAPALSHFLEEALVDMREMVRESSGGENSNGNGRSRL